MFEFGVRPEKSLQLLDREKLTLHVPGITGAESLRQGPQQFQPGGAQELYHSASRTFLRSAATSSSLP